MDAPEAATATTDLRIEVRSDPKLLGAIRSVVRGWFERHDVPQERLDVLVLAVDEACANAIRHAYEGRCDEVVSLELRAAPDALEVEVCDRGATAPRDAVGRRALSAPTPDELCPGGLGVQLIHRAFDDVRFCPGSPCGNRVVMRAFRGRGE